MHKDNNKGVWCVIIKPNHLNVGDKVAVIAPASPTDLQSVKNAEKRVEAMGLNPIMYPTCYSTYGHLSASDEDRAKDINVAFSDETIKGIICLRGGYGTIRILNMLDYEMIKKNPKIFVGFSDITALHIAFNQICRMVTYHGPMATSSFIIIDNGHVNIDKYTYDSLFINIFTDNVLGKYNNPNNKELVTISRGKAKGELIGGNLSLLTATLGSPYEIDTKGKILFIEEVGEPVYKIDRMLTSLALAGKFRDSAGIILGTCTNCYRDKKSYENGFDLPIEEVLFNTLLKYNKPIIANFQAGHNFPQPTLAFGTNIVLDADKKEILFTESGNRHGYN